MKDLWGNIEAFEMQYYQRGMKISHRDHVTNETVLDRVDQKRKLLPMVKSRKLKYFGPHFTPHLTREIYRVGHRPHETGRPTERMVR